MDLEILLIELSRNPEAIKKIEEQVEILVNYPDLTPLYSLQNSANPAVFIYICKIIEKRVRNRISSMNLQEEIGFCSQLLQKNKSYHVCELYSLMGQFCWPSLMPSFFDDILSLLNCKAGYQIFHSFLEKLNTSTEIDEARRNELKKAMGIISSELLKRLNNALMLLLCFGRKFFLVKAIMLYWSLSY